jgi:hypothetical protein
LHMKTSIRDVEGNRTKGNVSKYIFYMKIWILDIE